MVGTNFADAALAWLVQQTFLKTIPRISEQFRQDLQRERESSERGLRDVTEALERLSLILLLSHDAKGRGEAFGSAEDLLRVLRGKKGFT